MWWWWCQCWCGPRARTSDWQPRPCEEEAARLASTATDAVRAAGQTSHPSPPGPPQGGRTGCWRGGGVRAVISALPRAGGDLGAVVGQERLSRRCCDTPVRMRGWIEAGARRDGVPPSLFWLPNRETCHSVACGKLQRVAGRTSCLASAVQSGPLLAGSSQAKHRRGFLGNSFAVKAHSERENTLSASAGQLSPALDAAAIQQSVTQIVSKFERL